MLARCIRGANIIVRTDSDAVQDLHARRIKVGEHWYIISAWEPTPRELELLNQGRPVFLYMMAYESVPPVSILVPED